MWDPKRLRFKRLLKDWKRGPRPFVAFDPKRYQCDFIGEVYRSRLSLLDLAVRLRKLIPEVESEGASHFIVARNIGNKGVQGLTDEEYETRASADVRYFMSNIECNLLRELSTTLEELADTYPDAKSQWEECVRQRM